MLNITRTNRWTQILEDFKRWRCEQWLATRSKLTSMMQRQFLEGLHDVLHVCEFVRRK